MKTATFPLVLLAFFSHAAQASDRRFSFEEITLANGMRVISLEDFSCPIVAVQVWYHVGSSNEDPKRQGFAHMFEHMMFRGTDRLNETAHFDNIRRVGGNCNAYTAFDQTVYVQTLPANQLEMALWLESERMAFLKIDQKGFDTERKVVEEELRQGHNRPYGRVPERLLAEIYGTQPYAWTPGGQISHLRRSTIEELAEFWNKYYVPNNATLIVVGAVKHAEVQALAKKYFGWIPKCPSPPKAVVRPTDQSKPRTIKLPEDKGPLPVLGVVYRTVPDAAEDALPLQILMGVLGNGESSRLYRDVVKEKKIAQMAIAGALGLEKDGIAGAGAILLPFVGDKKGLMQAIKKHIDGIREAPITDAEHTKMKNQLRRQEIEAAETVSSKAQLLGKYAVLEGDAERINRRLEEIAGVNIEDVQRVAKKYLADERRMSVLIEPSAAGMITSLFKRNKDEDEGPPPETKENRVAPRTGPKAQAKRPEGFPSEPPSARLLETVADSEYPSTTLKNRLRVVVLPNHEVPLVRLILGVKSGGWSEDPYGQANAVMNLMTKATKTYNARQLAELLESNAIELSGSADMDAGRLTCSAMTDQADLAARILREVVQNPTFPEEEFDLFLKQTKMGLMISSRTPEYLADRELRRRLFGSHPYSRTPTGEIEDFDRLNVDRLRDWWQQNVRPFNCVLYIAGDIKPPDAFTLARDHFESWQVSATFAPRSFSEAPEASPTHIYLVDRPGSVQSQIRIGQTSITRSDPGYFTARVLSNIFGGGFNSRLNKAVRVEKGLTYGARGGLSPRRYGGQFTIQTFTRTDSTADTVRTVLREIDRIRSSPPDEKELADTKTYLAGAFAGERETPDAVVGDLWTTTLEGLPSDFFQQYLRAIASVSPEDVRKAANELIDPQRLVIVVVGEAAKIKADLEKIAPVTVVNAPTQMPEKPAGGKEAEEPEEG